MSRLRIILYQHPLGTNISRSDRMEMKAFRPHFVCFPEYFFVNRSLGNHGQTLHNQALQTARIRMLSKDLGATVIGGTMPELADGVMYNTSFVFHDGVLLGHYRKKNLFFAEEGKITVGDVYKTFSSQGVTFGVLICADIFHDEAFHFMREHGAKIIFSPTFSLIKNETVEDKYRRDTDIYVRAARIADAVIVKVCGVKSEYKNFIQARSLIADREAVLYRVRPDEEDRAMIIKQEIEV